MHASVRPQPAPRTTWVLKAACLPSSMHSWLPAAAAAGGRLCNRLACLPSAARTAGLARTARSHDCWLGCTSLMTVMGIGRTGALCALQCHQLGT